MSQHYVVVYVSDNCKHCESLLSFIEEKDISYELKNVSKSHTARQELRQQDIYGTAVTFIDNEIFLGVPRSEEHTSELQSRGHLVCRLLLEKKKKREQ